MARIEFQRLKIEAMESCGLPVCRCALPRLHQQRREMRRQPQRRLVVRRGLSRSPRTMQALPRLECSSEMVWSARLPGGSFVGRGEAALDRRHRGFDAPRGIIFQPDAQLPGDEGAGDIVVRKTGGESGGDHGLRITAGNWLDLVVTAKQNLAAAPAWKPESRRFASRHCGLAAGNVRQCGLRPRLIRRDAMADESAESGEPEPEPAHIVSGLSDRIDRTQAPLHDVVKNAPAGRPGWRRNPG